MSRLTWLCLFLVILISLLLVTACTQHVNQYPDLQFRDDVCLIPYRDYNFLTCDETEVYIEKGVIIRIPGGFNTDLASIPKWYWSVLAPNRVDLIAPSVLHDYLYACNAYVDKKDADEIFFSALIANEVSNRTAYEMYLAVSLFGQTHNHPEICKALPVFKKI